MLAEEDSIDFQLGLQTEGEIKVHVCLVNVYQVFRRYIRQIVLMLTSVFILQTYSSMSKRGSAD